MFRKRLWLKINNTSNFRDKRIIVEKSKRFSEGANYRSKIHGELSRDANYRSKKRANQNNRCHENAGKFCRNIVSSITSAQYCISRCEKSLAL